MIEIDKYEGHTQGPWYWDGNLCNDVQSDKHGINQWTVFDWEDGLLAKEVDMQLIADTPLILQALIDERAEVKRLREAISRAINTLLSNPSEEMFELRSPTSAQDIGDLIGFYTQAMGYAIGILEGTE